MFRQYSPWFLHVVQNGTLIFLSLTLLPLTSLVVLLSLAGSLLIRNRSQPVKNGASQPRRVLITGVGMNKGLALARIFSAAGHVVVGADPSSLACGRVSKSVSAYYTLGSSGKDQWPTDYIENLLKIIRKEHITLWVGCSSVSSAVEDGEASEAVRSATKCKVVQFDTKTTTNLHKKHTFIAFTRTLGLNVPETHTVTSRQAMEEVLCKAHRRKFIAKNVGVDDASRGDMTLLPCSSPEDTTRHIGRLEISEQNPWILQQFVNGLEFCTHALVDRGKVKAFVACPSSELLMHYQALPPESALSLAMLKFTQTFASKSGNDFTGHLSFDFLVEDVHAEDPEDVRLCPIECNPRVHTAVVLFDGTAELAEAYTSLLEAGSTRSNSRVITPLRREKYYWIGHDVVCGFLLPLFKFLCRCGSIHDMINTISEVFYHVMFWRDATYDVWDPLPWWWLYHVYWTSQFFRSLISGRRWSRINVSTTKIFGI